MKEFVITRNEAGQRFDKYLAKLLPLAAKGFLYKMLRKKTIILNGGKASGDVILKEGDGVRLFFSEETWQKFSGRNDADTAPPGNRRPRKTFGDIPVLYEDRDVIFFNKPAGILSQPDQSHEASMVEYLREYLLGNGSLSPEELSTFHPSVVNRLDRNTTGIIAAGKSFPGQQELSRLFRERQLEKWYLTICQGLIDEEAELQGFLVKDERENRVRILKEACPGASCIRTRYRPLSHGEDATLLEVQLLTGKPHQIRAHLASMGHPVLGDRKYGGQAERKGERRKQEAFRPPCHLLHAGRLVFPRMSGILGALSERTIEAPLPEDFVRSAKARGLLIPG